MRWLSHRRRDGVSPPSFEALPPAAGRRRRYRSGWHNTPPLGGPLHLRVRDRISTTSTPGVTAIRGVLAHGFCGCGIEKKEGSPVVHQLPLNTGGGSADWFGVDLRHMLWRTVEAGASDLHLKVGQPPILRLDGELKSMDDWAPLDSDQLVEIVRQVGASDPVRLESFFKTGELDTAYQTDELPRFRVNAFRQRGEISFAFRLIPS